MTTDYYGNRRRQLKYNDNNQLAHDEFLVFGYSATLHNPVDIHHESGNKAFDENKHLIPWNGDDNLKIDRYDCRLYLASLDSFDEQQKKKTEEQEINDDEEDSAEKLEEELCEEERYMDLYIDMQKKELEEAEFKNIKKAEIGFTYDDDAATNAGIKTNDKREVDQEVETDEPYQKPDLLKLPFGIVTPETMRQNALIERTAQFVVAQGPQMEIVIKAKQRHNMEQFGFLDFDHRLHSYYKYLCKLIREKKYTPQPAQAKRKQAKTPTPPLSEESGTDSDDEGGYLHPLLSGKSKTDSISVQPGFIGPTPKPLTPKSQVVKPESPGPDLNALLQQFHSASNQQNTLYSTLMKGLNSVLPGNKSEEKNKETLTKSESDGNYSASTMKTLFETDEHRINDYNKWHLEFYGRPSPYLPGPPPIPMPPEPESAVESSITVAAKYVTFHGFVAEQRLIDHNGDKVHFLFPRSPYYTYYQSRVRQLQWQLYQQSQQHEIKARNSPLYVGIPATSVSSSPLPLLMCSIPNPPQRPVSLIKQIQQQMNESAKLIPTELPIKHQGIPTFNEFTDETGEIENVTDKKQHERREKARLFMERILNERMAEKHRKIKKSEQEEEEQKSEQNKLQTPDSMEQCASSSHLTNSEYQQPNASAISPLQLSKAISTLIDEQIRRSLSTTAGQTEMNPMKMEKEFEQLRKQSGRSERTREIGSSDNEERDNDDETHQRSKRRRKDSRSSDRHRHRRSSRERSRSRSRSRSRRSRRRD